MNALTSICDEVTNVPLTMVLILIKHKYCSYVTYNLVEIFVIQHRKHRNRVF